MIEQKFLWGVPLFFGVCFANIAEANIPLLGHYKPSVTSKKIDQRRTVGSGSRSNCENSLTKDSLFLLVPEAQVVHQTISENPTLYFYQNVLDVPIDFTFVDPQVSEPLIEETLTFDRSGIQSLKIPVKLEPKKIYLWHLAIRCSNNPQQYQEVLGAGIEKITLNVETSQRLTGSQTEKAEMYAQQGIWYDALDFKLKNSATPINKIVLNNK